MTCGHRSSRRTFLFRAATTSGALAILLAVGTGCGSGHGSKMPAAATTPIRDPYLSELAGHWMITRTDGAGTSSQSMTATWVLADTCLHVHMEDTASPPEYEASVLLARDREGRYVAVWCDTFGGEYASIGFGVREADSVRFRFERDSGVFYNTITRNAQADSWTFQGWEAQAVPSPHPCLGDGLWHRSSWVSPSVVTGLSRPADTRGGQDALNPAWTSELRRVCPPSPREGW